MRIAVTADPEIPVPPVLYGGIERIVDMLIVRSSSAATTSLCCSSGLQPPPAR